MQLRSVRSWIVPTRTMLRPTIPAPRRLLNLKNQNVPSKIHLKRVVRSSIITTDEKIEAVERIVMHDRQISVRCLAYKLAILTATVYAIMSNDVGMKKVSTRRVPKLLTLIQRATRVDCCQELLEENEVNLDNYFDDIVSKDET